MISLKWLVSLWNDGSRIMLWGCFSASGTGALNRVDGIMKNLYSITSNHQLDGWKLVHNWVFQQDTDPNHTPKLAVELIREANITKICGLCVKVLFMPGNQQIYLNSTNSAHKISKGKYPTWIPPEACLQLCKASGRGETNLSRKYSSNIWIF